MIMSEVVDEAAITTLIQDRIDDYKNACHAHGYAEAGSFILQVSGESAADQREAISSIESHFESICSQYVAAIGLGDGEDRKNLSIVLLAAMLKGFRSRLDDLSVHMPVGNVGAV